MLNFPLFTVFLILGTFRFGNGMSVYNGMLSAAKIKVIAEYPCEESAIINPKIDVRPGDSFDIAAEIETQLDNTNKVLVQIDKFVGNKWQENFIFFQGQLCDTLNKYAKKLWDKFRLTIDPQIMDSCIIPKGQYVANNVSISPTELVIPSVFYGLWRVIFRMYNTDEKLVVCRVLELESQKSL